MYITVLDITKGLDMAKTGQLYIDNMTITHQAPEPVYELGKQFPVGRIGTSLWYVDMSLVVFDKTIIDKLTSGVLNEEFFDSVLATKMYMRPCCQYCGTPINVREQPVKCSSCGAPLGG